MGDDSDPFDLGVDEEYDPGAEAERRARDMETELLERHETPESRVAQRAAELSSAEVSTDVSVPFWAAVVYANVGLLLVTLGPMLAYFRGQVGVGGAMTVGGLFALYRTYTMYREFARDRDAADGRSD